MIISPSPGRHISLPTSSWIYCRNVSRSPNESVGHWWESWLGAWLIQQPDRSHACEKLTAYGPADWIRLNWGWAGGHKANPITQQNKSPNAIFHNLHLPAARLKAGDRHVFTHSLCFEKLCENCRLVFSHVGIWSSETSKPEFSISLHIEKLGEEFTALTGVTIY